MMLNRRRFLSGAGALVGASALGCGRSADGPIDVAAPPPKGLPWLGLARSLPEEHDYRAEVEGTIPPALRGRLVRNGPGLFERGSLRKQSILDGDGMLQCFDFAAEGVRYRNRFVRTEKYLAEQASGSYEYATWTTQAPGGRLANLFGSSIANQAGVSVHEKQGTLYAFDETNLPYALDPETLETRGLSRLGLPEDEHVVFAAHPKTDGQTGEWIHFGLKYARGVTAQLTGFDAKGAMTLRRDVELPRYAYVHDFFVTPRFIVFNIHPANIRIFDFLFGGSSLVGAMRWEPEQGNQVLLVPRDASQEVQLLEAESHWMWHALNAYEEGGEIVADLVGHDDAGAFLGPDPELFAVMEGRSGSRSRGRLRRYRIDPVKGSLRLETLSDAHHEFPIVNPARACRRSRFGYLARSAAPDGWWTQLVRFDTDTGAESVYDFGARRFCAEPVFVPDPTRPDAGGSADEHGWLLSQVYDASTEKSFLAILDANRVSDGPVATVQLRHHVPLSLHGSWVAA